ncbi:MAG: hypothetical protein AB7U82_34915 [Blastocatellales bacterium]
MKDETKNIVASNLTEAYARLAERQKDPSGNYTEGIVQEQVWAAYQVFVAKLEDAGKEPGFVGVLPEVG